MTDIREATKFREKDFLRDFNAGKNAAEAASLKWWIMKEIAKRPMTADDIYKESECGDIAMYLALHELVNTGILLGISPYDVSAPNSHKDMHYKLSDAGSAQFFTGAAEHVCAWDSDVWNRYEVTNEISENDDRARRGSSGTHKDS